MNKKNIIVTGGTDGIGLAIVNKLINEDHFIYIVGKDGLKGNKVLNSFKNSNLEFFQCDLSEKEEIKKLIKIFNNFTRIDVLINNAGAIFDNRILNSEGVEKTFALNHLSYFQLSLGLLDKLENSIDPRIVNISSNAHKRYKLDINDLESENNYNGWKAYCRSKLLNLYFSYLFKKKLKTKVNSNCLHPGFVNSNFGNNNKNFYRFLINILKNLFAISPEEASLSPLYLALNNDLKNTNGKYFYKLKEKKSSIDSYDIDLANKVWVKSLEYIK